MNKYQVVTSFSGYSRGHAYHIVEANSEEEAKENWWDGELIHTETMRDDREHEPESVELVKPDK